MDWDEAPLGDGEHHPGRVEAALPYSEALAATEYLEARKGRTALLQILELLGERYTMNDALKKVIGLDYQELQTAWEADLERYRPPDR